MQGASSRSIYEILEIFQRIWASDTTSDPQNWHVDNPAWGQCAVTALLAQDMLGGDIVRVEYNIPETGEKGSHYFNVLDDLTLVDFTYSQFPDNTNFAPLLDVPAVALKDITTNYLIDKDFKGSVRDYLLSSETTAARYEKLKRRYSQASAANDKHPKPNIG